MEQKLLTTKQVMEYFNVKDSRTIKKFIKQGLKVIPIGTRDFRFDRKDVEEFADVLNFNNKYVKLGISIAEKDLMAYGASAQLGFIVLINNETIRLGREGIYEVDDWMVLNQVSFPYGAPASTLVEYVIKTD